MNVRLPTLKDSKLQGKSVLVRADIDVPGPDSLRWKVTKQMVDWLNGQSVKKIKIIGHKGGEWMQKELGVEMNWDLRSDAREETNNDDFAKELAADFDVYINEAFAVAHRNHTSVVALPKFMKSMGKEIYAGLRFENEVENLGKILEKEGKKVLVIGGAKAGDKADYADKLQGLFDVVLRGGLLPGVNVRADGLDLADEAIESYKQEIAGAVEIVVAGPMGKFEDEISEKGTREVFGAVAGSTAFKVAGGGDTENALSKFKLTEKFEWVSVGGGAMLQFMAEATLPGIEALI